MPVIRPFRGLRYNSEVAGAISDNVAPPYDIIFDEWREKLYERSQYNIIRLIKTKDEPGDNDQNNKYTRAAECINDWMDKDALAYDEKPAIYLRADTYTVKDEERTRYGFIALLKIEDFGDNVHPHERTLSAPKADRLNLVKTTKTNLSQIFSIYRDPDYELNKVMEACREEEPEVDFIDEQNIRRRLWAVTDSGTIEKIVSFIDGRDIIIADGHHRYETAINYKKMMDAERSSDYEPFDYVSMYFANADDPGMTILPTHRKVSYVSSFNQRTFFWKLAEAFDVEYFGSESNLDDVLAKIDKMASETNAYGVYTCDGWGLARLKNPADPKELDVDILHNIIIEKMLGVSREDIASGKYVHFCKSADHAIEDVANNVDQISFFMNAVTTEELFRTVLKGVRMPQKSTYFFPKTMSGLVMYKIDEESLG